MTKCERWNIVDDDEEPSSLLFRLSGRVESDSVLVTEVLEAFHWLLKI